MKFEVAHVMSHVPDRREGSITGSLQFTWQSAGFPPAGVTQIQTPLHSPRSLKARGPDTPGGSCAKSPPRQASPA